MSMTISVRVAHKSSSKASGQRRHDTRTGKIPEYVDADRIEQNSVIIQPDSEANLRAVCLERRALRPTQRAMKSDAAIATVGIITFGREAQRVIAAMPRARQDAMFNTVSAKLAEATGNEITGLVVHRDESAIHAHFQMPAVARDGRPMSKVIDRAMAKRMQDIAGHVVESIGITRGTPKAERLAKGEPISQIIHRSVAQLHADLPKEVTELQAKIDNYRRLADKARKQVELDESKAEAAAKRIETYERRITDTQAQLDKLQPTIDALRNTAPPPAPQPKTIEIEVIAKKGFFGIGQKIGLAEVVHPNEAQRVVKVAEAREQAILASAAYRIRSVEDEYARKEQSLASREQAIQRREQEQDTRDSKLDDRAAIIRRVEVETGIVAPTPPRTKAKKRDMDVGR